MPKTKPSGDEGERIINDLLLNIGLMKKKDLHCCQFSPEFTSTNHQQSKMIVDFVIRFGPTVIFCEVKNQKTSGSVHQKYEHYMHTLGDNGGKCQVGMLVELGKGNSPSRLEATAHTFSKFSAAYKTDVRFFSGIDTFQTALVELRAKHCTCSKSDNGAVPEVVRQQDEALCDDIGDISRGLAGASLG